MIQEVSQLNQNKLFGLWLLYIILHWYNTFKHSLRPTNAGITSIEYITLPYWLLNFIAEHHGRKQQSADILVCMSSCLKYFKLENHFIPNVYCRFRQPMNLITLALQTKTISWGSKDTFKHSQATAQ